jgi:hypothetical protein
MAASIASIRSLSKLILDSLNCSFTLISCFLNLDGLESPILLNNHLHFQIGTQRRRNANWSHGGVVFSGGLVFISWPRASNRLEDVVFYERSSRIVHSINREGYS